MMKDHAGFDLRRLRVFKAVQGPVTSDKKICRNSEEASQDTSFETLPMSPLRKPQVKYHRGFLPEKILVEDAKGIAGQPVMFRRVHEKRVMAGTW